MRITKIIDGEFIYNDIPVPTDDEMQRDYDYILAEEMTKRLLHQFLISQDEFQKIMRINLVSFAPYISKIIG